jgi:hypothetical protein
MKTFIRSAHIEHEVTLKVGLKTVGTHAMVEVDVLLDCGATGLLWPVMTCICTGFHLNQSRLVMTFQFGYLAISFYGRPVTVTVFPKIVKKPDWTGLLSANFIQCCYFSLTSNVSQSQVPLLTLKILSAFSCSSHHLFDIQT